MNNSQEILVYTVKDRCRVCYTCVRECPVKAIKIINGQAEVMPERCIACGNCVNICSQGAKTFSKQIAKIEKLLAGNSNLIAAVAPSFPAEFTELTDYKQFPGMLRTLGFNKVIEVSFGADIVAKKYNELLAGQPDKSFISSDCPAVVACIEKHHPSLTGNLAPIVSPMVALCRVIRDMYGDDQKIVFIGPCIAKKGESDEIDGAITFTEVREMLNKSGIEFNNVRPSEFDPPYSGKGSIFPVSHGLLNTMGKTADVTECDIVVANGKKDVMDAITEYEKGTLQGNHLELLCCDGCIMGPGMSKNGSRLNRIKKISDYAKDKLIKLDKEEWNSQIKSADKIDYTRTFNPEQIWQIQPSDEEIKEALKRIGKFEATDHLNCKACGYDTCREHAIAIVNGFAEDEMCLPHTIEMMHYTINNLNVSNEKLATARQALKQSEKLANMGQLSAGIAHELNNPLGVISMYSNILKEEAKKDDPIIEDLNLIVEQADRCKKIVGGLLNFARKNQVVPVDTNIVEFCKRSLQSVVIPHNVITEFICDNDNIEAEIDKDQMMQAITNLEKNAIDAMPDGGKLIVNLHDLGNEFSITITDEGCGIKEENMEKVFTPFFTTKGIGKGTGMGLPLVYGIVKMHKGQIIIESNADEAQGPTGTSFILRLPKKPVLNN